MSDQDLPPDVDTSFDFGDNVQPKTLEKRAKVTAQEFAERLGGSQKGSGWIARCPAHDDSTPSLSIAEGSSGKVLLHCFAGCDAKAVAGAAGLQIADLMGEGEPDRLYDGRRIDKAYPYRDADGTLLFEVLRLAPKDFRQRRPDSNGGWLYDLAGVKKVPYRLPELLAADPERIVFVVEGEKDVDALRAFQGVVATTNPGGAGKWRIEYSSYLKGRKAVIIPDADKVGQEHALDVLEKVKGEAAAACVLQLPGGKSKDVSDWLQMKGSSIVQLVKMAYDALATASETATDVSGESPTYTTLEMLKVAENLPQEPGHLAGRFFVPTTMSMLIGPTGVGKTTMSMWLGRCIALGEAFGPWKTRKGKVLFLSCEMSEEELAPVVADLFTEAEARQMGDQFLIRCRPDLRAPSKLDEIPEFVQRVRQAVEKETKVDVVLMDALADLHLMDENSNSAMGALMRQVRNGVARALSCAVAVLHHVGKPSELRFGTGLARGASVFRDVVASMFTVEWKAPTAEEGPRIVKVAKGRRREKGQPTTFGFDIVSDDRRNDGGLRLEFIQVAESDVSKPKMTKSQTRVNWVKEYFEAKGVEVEISKQDLNKAIQQKFGCSPTTAYQVAADCLSQGVLEEVEGMGLYRLSTCPF